MHHWQDPWRRGIYTHPNALPPRPSHPYANDLSARLARVEEHLHFGAMDRHRIEDESRLRAKDLAESIESQDERLTSIGERLETQIAGVGARLAVIEQDRHTYRTLWLVVATLAGSASGLLRYALIVLLALLLLTGHPSIDKLRPLFGTLGVGSG